jgi:hypothetical protein
LSFMSPPPPGHTPDDELPPDDTVRWVPRRKAAVLRAIADGRISLEDACTRWRLSVEEIELWQRAMRQIGVHGLRVTRVQIYRSILQDDH